MPPAHPPRPGRLPFSLPQHFHRRRMGRDWVEFVEPVETIKHAGNSDQRAQRAVAPRLEPLHRGNTDVRTVCQICLRHAFGNAQLTYLLSEGGENILNTAHKNRLLSYDVLSQYSSLTHHS